ncbi:peptidoglycan-binding domain-containing protein [Thiocystis minor]|uniref:peptidoglycan-binding domain-containing protein n=1 Tax=Thiocystis minor TaxID=61597 RepID=UPI003B82DF57
MKEAQQQLNDLGYMAGEIDGKVGRKTIRAVYLFQWCNGLKTTKTLDADTLSWLQNERKIDAQHCQYIINYQQFSLM